MLGIVPTNVEDLKEIDNNFFYFIKHISLPVFMNKQEVLTLVAMVVHTNVTGGRGLTGVFTLVAVVSHRNVASRKMSTGSIDVGGSSVTQKCCIWKVQIARVNIGGSGVIQKCCNWKVQKRKYSHRWQWRHPEILKLECCLIMYLLSRSIA